MNLWRRATQALGFASQELAVHQQVQQPPLVRPTFQDDVTGLVTFPVPPDRARWMLENAVRGDLAVQADLFRLMLDTWPRAAKAVAEVSGKAKRLTWHVQAAVVPGERQATEQSELYAESVQRALRSWAPEPGTLELTFEETLEAILVARTHGISVVELVWRLGREGWMPRTAWRLGARSVGWSPDGTRLGLVRGSARAWESFPRHRVLAGLWRGAAGAPGASALLRPLVPYWIGRTYGWQWLLQAAQVFGVPIRVAKYDQSRPDVGRLVADMLRNMGSSGYAALPTGTELEVHEAVTNASGSPQVVLQQMADEACDVLLLGQRLSTEAGGGGLGDGTAKLQGGVRAEVIAEAAWWLADVLNYQLVPAVLALNHGEVPAELAPVVSPDLSGFTDFRAAAERLEILGRTGLRIPRAWAHEMSGVPEPQDGDALLAAPPQPPAFPGAQAGGAETARGAAPNGAIRGGGAPGGAVITRSHPAEASAKGRGSHFLGVRAAAAAPAWAPPERSRVAQRVFEDVTGVSARWLGLVRDLLEGLIDQAQADDGRVSEEEFARVLEEAARRAPELFGEVEVRALAESFERAMGAEMVNGAAERAREQAAADAARKERA